MQSRSSAVITAAVTTLALSGLSSAATVTWTGTTDSNWDTTTGNWSGGVPNASLFVDGDAATFGAATNRTIAVAAPYNVGLVTFTSAINGNYAFSGGALTFTGGLTNSNTTASRSVTFGNNIAIGAAQTWASTNTNGITVFNGNLTNSGGPFNLILSTNDTRTALPSIRLNGSNSGYTGNITLTGSTTSGIMLMKPSAMTGGNIDLGSGDRNIWLQSGTGTYTFGIGTGAGEVSFRNAGSGGLKLTGGNVTLDPGNGGSYAFGAETNPRLRLGRQLTTENNGNPYVLTLGNSNSGSYLIIGNNNFVISMGEGGGTGNDPRYNPIVKVASGLSDNGAARNLAIGEGGNSSPFIASLNAAAGGVGANLGGTTTINNGAHLHINGGMNRIFNGGLDLGASLLGYTGGVILEGVAWDDFVSNRSGGFTTGAPASNQWRLNGGGFSARGSQLLISDNGTSTSTFDRNFTLGTGLLDTDGNYYANAGVTITRNTTLTANRVITMGTNGSGLRNTTGVVHGISGNLSGSGSISVNGENFALGGTGSPFGLGELVLSGSNSWTGGSSFSQGAGVSVNLGAGGLWVQRALVRFDGDASLPTGSGGNAAYLAALDRNNSARGGFLLTGGVTEKAYDLPTGYRFMIGGSNGGENAGIFGAAGGIARLQNSTILVHVGNATTTNTLALNLLVREDSLLRMGSTVNGEARIAPSAGQETANAAGPATAVTTATGTRTLILRGGGTLSLDNIAYTQADGTGNTASQFIWQIGRAQANNSGSTAYFDGALRETGNNATNSLSGFNVQLAGGVLETNNTLQGGGFTRATGTSAAQVQWNSAGGGGFSAFGGPLTVNLGGAAASQTWGTGPFVRTNDSLIFGSNTADNAVTWMNPIALNGAAREIRVIDNVNSANDRAVIDAVLSGTGSSALTKTGGGILELKSGRTHTYAGATTVSAGTLLVNGSITGTGAVTVSANATLGGSGTLSGVTTVNGVVSPGNSIGTLTVANDVTWNSNNAWVFELGTSGEATLALADTTPSNNDRLNLTGAGSDFFKGTGTSFTFDFAGTGGNGWYKLVDWVGTTNFLYTDFVASNLPLGSTATFLVDNATSALYVNVVVPEPTSIALLGLAGLTLGRRRRAA